MPFQGISAGSPSHLRQSVPRNAMHSGLGSSPSARRYSGNRFFFPENFFFLFLRLLGCFGSPGSLPRVMDSRAGTRGFPAWVPPFRHPRIKGYVPLPAAFRSLSRLSSAPSAGASALRPFCLTRSPPPSVAAARAGSLLVLLSCSWMPADTPPFRDSLPQSSSGIRFSRYGGRGRAPLPHGPGRRPRPDGLKWTRTTDLTLIRRAL